MKIPFYQIDAFTNKVFGGNPAAICPLENWLPDETMQAIAAENNLAETAFFVKMGDDFELRWFTPEMEVDLCGHATLASGHVLFNHLDFKPNQINFHTKSGILKVSRTTDLLSMEFPSRKPLATETPQQLVDGLGRRPAEVLKSRDYFAVFQNEQEVLSIQPDFNILEQLDCLGIIITAAGQTSDFVSRFFAPRAGIPEDPVTGSAHCSLVPYWSEKLHKKDLHALQLSKRRGELFCQDLGERVSISGNAVTFATGTIYL
ncbi:PhzF family phenazine biosynthesis protein [candidate division KSB1 bacterium]|nr:PhzF family phenazine biosynthesis protein [candidate division KSB1 bacterium]